MGSVSEAFAMLAFILFSSLLHVVKPCLPQPSRPTRPPSLFPGASFGRVNRAIDSALSAANKALSAAGVDPLKLPQIKLPLGLDLPFIGQVQGNMVLSDGLLAGMASLARKADSKVSIGGLALRTQTAVGLGPLSSPFAVELSGPGGIGGQAPRISVLVKQLGVNIGLS